MNTNFYSLWFDPTGNRTEPFQTFSSRRFIHSTTDRLKVALSQLETKYKQLEYGTFIFLNMMILNLASSVK